MIVTVLAFTNMQILLTLFFTWASIHVLHQISYINDSYAAKRPVRRPLRDKVIDYGVIFTCLYPMATPQVLDGEFQLGGEAIYVPEFVTHGFLRDLHIFGAFALFGIFLVLWIGKNLRDYRQGQLLFPSVLLIGLTIVIGFTLPLFPNLDVAFQGFNCWHSFQYLALIWYLNLMRKERGELDNHFIAEANGPDRPLALLRAQRRADRGGGPAGAADHADPGGLERRRRTTSSSCRPCGSTTTSITCSSRSSATWSGRATGCWVRRR